MPLLRSPELLNRLQRMGSYLRYESALEPRLSEFGILLPARNWSKQYEWYAHQKLAVKAGVAPAVMQAIAEGRRSTGMSADEEIVYDFIDELTRNKSVRDPTYARVRGKFGGRGIIDLIAINGYYSLLAAVLNVAPLPGNAPQQIPTLPRRNETGTRPLGAARGMFGNTVRSRPPNHGEWLVLAWSDPAIMLPQSGHCGRSNECSRAVIRLRSVG